MLFPIRGRPIQVAVLTLVVQQWIPVLRWALWDPKDRAAAALKKRHGLPWSVR